MSIDRHSCRALALLAIAGSGTLAHADEPAADEPGLFASGELVAGALVKAQVAGGWGDPHGSWAGAEVLALSTTEFGAVYAGLRGHLSFLDATIGLRETAAYEHAVLPVQMRYTSTDGAGSPVRYASLDASLVGYAPVPLGYAMVWTDLVYPLGLGSTERVFEEYERVVVGSGTTFAARVAYLFSLRDDAVLLGPMAEGVWMGRRDATAWRVGGAVFWTINPKWTVYTVLTTPIAGTDDLGAWDGLWGTAGVRYRWAARARR